MARRAQCVRLLNVAWMFSGNWMECMIVVYLWTICQSSYHWPIKKKTAVDAYNEASLLFGVVSDHCLPASPACQVLSISHLHPCSRVYELVGSLP